MVFSMHLVKYYLMHNTSWSRDVMDIDLDFHILILLGATIF